jgi:hypothetical protein
MVLAKTQFRACGKPSMAPGVVGFRLFAPEDVPTELPEAVAVSIRIPETR